MKNSVSRTELLMAISALCLAIVASLLPGCATTPKRPAPQAVVQMSADEPTEELELPERRVITWSKVTDAETGKIVSQNKQCRWEPSGDPCQPGTF